VDHAVVHGRLSWQPRRLGWLVAVLFIGGSLLFALGSLPVFSQNVDARVVGITFFSGSLMFTAAAYGSWLEVIDIAPSFNKRKYWAVPGDLSSWWSAFVQLVGTLLFNVSTFAALITVLSVQQENRLVWAPDLFGSAAFLIASHLAWREVRARGVQNRSHSPDWWIAVLNYVGSALFAVSAIGAFVLPTTGELLNTTLVDTGTFFGALFFLAGSYLLLPDNDGLAP
jgi:uncharacterized membrane protein YkvI